MSDESKEESSAEFIVGFNAEEGYRQQRGKDMSTTGPGPGNQRAVLEGEYGEVRNRLLREEVIPEQTFRSAALNYLKASYPGLEASQHQTIISLALAVPNYQNLVLALLTAAIYFRQRTPLLRNRGELTAAILDEHAAIVLNPLLNYTEQKKVGQTKPTREVYLIQLKADLLRYLYYILPA